MKQWFRYERKTLGRAFWCGTIAGLLAMVMALNCFPLQNIYYTIYAPTILSPAYLRHFESLIRQEGAINVGPYRVVGIQRTGSQSIEASSRLQKPNSVPLTSANLQLLSRFVPERFELESSLAEATHGVVLPNDSEELGKKIRQAKWRREAIRHAQRVLVEDRNRNLSLLASTPIPSKAEETDMVTSEVDSPLGAPIANTVATPTESESPPSNESPFQVASNPRIMESPQDAQLESQLARDLDQVEQTLRNLTADQKSQRNPLEGTIAISRSFRVRPVSPRISTSQLLGLLLIGMTTWAVVIWSYLRLARGGGSDPRRVIAWLERIGIPNIGNLSLLGREPVQDHRNALRLMGTLEWGLLLIACWIAFRFAYDQHWRTLVIEQPLGGLARLFNYL